MSFFLSPKFWLPLVIVLGFELFFAAGLWEPLVKPGSFAGRTVNLKKALETLDPDAPYYMTLGDSLALFGVEHERLHRFAAERGAEHYRMALAGSHIASLQMHTQWAREHLPNVEGMVIGLGIRAFRSVKPRYYELNATAPFRSISQIPWLVDHVGLELGEPHSYGTISAMLNYREDIADLLKAPKKRRKALVWASEFAPADALLFEAPPSVDICPIDLATPQSCLNSIAALGTLETGRGKLKAVEVQRECNRAARGLSTTISNAQAAQVGAEWEPLLTSLSETTRVVLVLMPVHPMLREQGLPDNLYQVAQRILEPLVAAGTIELLDLTTLFDHQQEPPCHYLHDLLHAGAAGRALITQSLQTYLDEIQFYH